MTPLNNIKFGDRRLVGQAKAKDQIQRMLKSERLSHAYLLTGPEGSGKIAFALALAEYINGIDNITDLKGNAATKKSGWYTHPDVHLFIPHPRTVAANELKQRLEMLADDPYEIVDFSLRPALNNPESTKNLQAFYSIEYYHTEIRPRTVYKPNEGKKSVVIITGIETMRKESANAFLKLLEEPSPNLMFILTASKTEQLLPTIISRCQQIRLQPLSHEEVADGLVRFDGINEEDAKFLARMSGGNYSLARFFDVETLQKTRGEIVDFLRYSYTQDAPLVLALIKDWNSGLNRENQIGLCNTMEQFLRDILIYRETSNIELVTNIDQADVIQRFCNSMEKADVIGMIEQLQQLKRLLYQNVQFKYVFTVLSTRFTSLMRGTETAIPSETPWRHMPAYNEGV
ncbi:MAG: AAA family ATPase [Balneolaceae bacterium]|nr:MAG: AAA family ATPase [Balneolaceae bacterium]